MNYYICSVCSHGKAVKSLDAPICCGKEMAKHIKAMTCLELDSDLCLYCGACDTSLRDSLGEVGLGILESLDNNRLLISESNLTKHRAAIDKAVESCPTGALSLNIA